MIKFFREVRSKLLMQLPVAKARKVLNQPGGWEKGDGQRRQLLVDVSMIMQSDAGTGIQRVVRAILSELALQLPRHYELRPVFATKRHAYHYAPANLTGADSSLSTTPGALVKAQAGDIFFGLDLCAHILPRRCAQLERWKQAGVSVHMMVYDLLPLQSPEWFYKRTTANFQRWLRTIAVFADSLICISNTVRRDLEQVLSSQFNLTGADAPALHVLRLGADLEATVPSRGISAAHQHILQQLRQHQTVLIVGTLEPRKGHKDLLRAFERLWQQGQSINLVICGKPGWKTELLQQRILQHPELGQHLFWLHDASDETLAALYKQCDGVVVASFGEGFGLPLFEALRFNKPVLARDIPVFREIGGDQVHFFNATESRQLAQHIVQWLALPKPPPHAGFITFTWHDTVRCLLSQLTPLQQGHDENGHAFGALPQMPMFDGKL